MNVFEEPEDATPLAPNEREGLCQSWITHRRDLNEAEQAKILSGRAWARRQKHTSALDIINETFLRTLHARMFGDVWTWAGRYRLTERNIGVPAYRVAVDLAVLIDDAHFWISNATYEPDELSIRSHHR